MKKRQVRNENFKFNLILGSIAFIITIFAIISGSYSQGGYDIQVNSISPTRFIAPYEVENVIATNRRRAAAVDSVKEIPKQDPAVNEKIISQLNNFFDQAFERRKEYIRIFNPYEANNDDTVAGLPPTPLSSEKPKLSVYLTDAQLQILLTMDTAGFNKLQQDLTDIMNKTMDQGVKSDNVEKSLLEVKDGLTDLGYTADMKSLGYEIVSSFLVSNMVVDEEATLKARQEKAAEIEPVIFVKGQKIVDENDIITPEIFAVLESLAFTNRSYMENIIPLLGAVILSAIAFCVSILYIYYFHKGIYHNRKELLLIFTLYVFVVSASRILIGVPYLLIPLLIFTMLIAMLLGARLAVMLNISATVVSLLVFKGDLHFLIFYIFSGTAIALFARYTTERNKIFLIGLMLSLVNIAVVLGLAFFFESSYAKSLVDHLFYALISGLFTVILSMGSLPFWEAVFGVITPVKLLDLTNANNALLRRMTIEAPGTYHHSLIVANLAETAAYEIQGNPSLARVGGYYHDIGKLKYPQYFAENQVGENPHDDMDPYASVEVIISHVAYGLELANFHRLPQVVRDIVEQHHGTTLIKYFYYSAKKANPDEEILESDFRYPFPTPQSKEAAVVMLADTVEAAVRSMIPSGKTMSEVESFVRTLIKDKLDDGQLLDSGLTIKDLDTIAHSFMRVFKGMYHERIPYPKAPAPAHGSDEKEKVV